MCDKRAARRIRRSFVAGMIITLGDSESRFTLNIPLLKDCSEVYDSGS